MRAAGDAIFTIAHVLTAVLGFGAVCVTGVEANIARRDPSAGSVTRYFKPAPNWISLSLLLTPIFGGLIEVVNNYPDVHLLWPWLALGIWIVALGTGLAVHWPAERRIQCLVSQADGEPGKDLVGLRRECLRASLSSIVMVAAFVAALVVMVTQPA